MAPINSVEGRIGEGFDRAVVDGGYRGDELFDALEVGVRAGGALGARLRLVELRLLWRDWVSIRLSILKDALW